jgi:hypothetical protein
MRAEYCRLRLGFSVPVRELCVLFWDSVAMGVVDRLALALTVRWQTGRYPLGARIVDRSEPGSIRLF